MDYLSLRTNHSPSVSTSQLLSENYNADTTAQKILADSGRTLLHHRDFSTEKSGNKHWLVKNKSLHKNNIPQIKVNDRSLKIVVCARQFMAMEPVLMPAQKPMADSEGILLQSGSFTVEKGENEGLPVKNEQLQQSGSDKSQSACKAAKFRPVGQNSILVRGYGDVASGVKVIELLQNEYPEAEISFIVEHFAETKPELRRIIEMSTLPDVVTIIMDGNIGYLRHQQVRDRAVELLNDATAIVHAPAGLIDPVMHSSGEYKKKTLAVSEYDLRSGRYNNKGNHGIREVKMGFKGDGVYLTPKHRAVMFKNTTLDRLFPVNCASKTLDDSVFQKKSLYFSYGHVLAAINNMLRNALLNECAFEREVVFVTSLTMDIDEAEQVVSTVLSDHNLTQVIKLVCEENGRQVECLIPKDACVQQAKIFSIVSLDVIVKDDFSLLEQYSAFNYTSGDISTTNVLAFGKIPFVDCEKKKINFKNIHKKLIDFAYMQLSVYEDAGIPGREVPEEVWVTAKQRYDLVLHWKNVCKSLSECQDKLSMSGSEVTTQKTLTDSGKTLLQPGNSLAGKAKSEDFPVENERLSPEQLLDSLKALNSPEWLTFQNEFTTWLKSTHSADAFILSHIRNIIQK